MLGITTTNARVGGFRGGISAEAKTIYNRIIADGGVSNLSRLNFFVKGLKAIYGDLANVPVCYDAHWIGYKLGSGTGATAGQAAAKLYSLTVAGDAVQSTAASQPLLLAHNGDNYWWGSGVSGNYVSTPNASANQITGDIEIIAKVSLVGNVGFMSLAAKWNGANNSYIFSTNTGNLLTLYINSGANFATSNVAFAANFNGFVKVTRTVANGEVKFYTSSDGITYTQLGTSVILNIGAILSSAANVEIGAYNAGTSAMFQGKIYRATISNSIGGAPVVDFNPATYNAATSQTAWTSSTGEVWTINTGTATTGYKGVLVDRTIVQSDGVDDEMSSSAFAINQPNTSYTVYNYYNDISKTVIDGLTNDTRNLLTSSTVGVTGLYAGTATFNLSGFSKILRQLRTFGLNGITSYGMANNSSRTTGIAGVLNASGVHLFRGGNGFGNNTFYTHINTSILDTAQNNTDMYNLVRSLNENAF